MNFKAVFKSQADYKFSDYAQQSRRVALGYSRTNCNLYNLLSTKKLRRFVICLKKLSF